MAFYLIDRTGHATYINANYLRSRLLSGTSDENIPSATALLNEIDAYPENIRTLISKININTSVYTVEEITQYIMSEFSEDDDKVYRSALLTLEKSHFLALVFLMLECCITKVDVQRFLDMDKLRNRTELLLTYLEIDKSTVNIFSQLEEKIRNIGNFKNKYEVYNAADYTKIKKYLSELVGKSYPLSDYFGRRNFDLSYVNYKHIYNSEIQGISELFTDILADKWVLHEVTFDSLLGNDVRELEEVIKDIDSIIHSVKYNFGAGGVFGSNIFDAYDSYDKRKVEIDYQESQLTAAKSKLKDKYEKATKYDNSDSIKIKLDKIIYNYLDASLPEMINYKFYKRSEKDQTSYFPANALRASYLKNFSEELSKGIATSSTHARPVREVNKRVQINLTDLNDRFFEMFSSTDMEQEFKLNNFCKLSLKQSMKDTTNDIIKGNGNIPSDFMNKMENTNNPLSPLYKPFTYLGEDRLYQLISKNQSLENFFPLLEPMIDIDKILNTNILINDIIRADIPLPGTNGFYTAENITFDISDKDSIDVLALSIEIDDKNLENLYPVKINLSTNSGTTVYTTTFNETTKTFDTITGPADAMEFDIQFDSYKYEPDFYADVYIGIYDEENDKILYSDKVNIEFKKVARQNIDRFIVENFGTSSIMKYFKELFKSLNLELETLNGGPLRIKDIPLSLKSYLPKLYKKCGELVNVYKNKNDSYLYAYVFDIVKNFIEYLIDDSITTDYTITVSEPTYIYYLEQFIGRQMLISMSELIEKTPMIGTFKQLQYLERGVSDAV